MKNNLFLHVLLIFALFAGAGCVSQSGSANADNFDTQKAAKDRISLGLSYLQKGNFRQAKFNLDKALQFAPRLADAHYAMAYYFQQVEEAQKAKQAYLTALDLAPDNADIANSYGAFLCESGDYAQAKAYFLKAINNKNYVSAAQSYENLALCSQSQGQLNDAVVFAQNAVNHSPSRGKSLLLLAQLQAEARQWQVAESSLQRYDRLGNVSSASLSLWVKVKMALGQPQAALSYQAMLGKMYPNDQQAAPTTSSVVAKVKKSKKVSPAFTPQAVEAAPVETEQGSHVSQASQQVLIAADRNKQATRPQQWHWVQKSENLYRISLLYNIRMTKLIEWNQLADASAIYHGMKLYIVDPKRITNE